MQGNHSPDLTIDHDDEHASIANLSTALVPDKSSPQRPILPINSDHHHLSTPRSPLQIVSQIDDMQREELDQILRQLELDNKYVIV
jgi:hypothetical protein